MSDISDNKIMYLGIGFGLGFLSAWIVIKRDQITQPPLSPLQQSDTQRKHGFMGGEGGNNVIENPLANWKPLSKIPHVDAIAEGREELSVVPVTSDTNIQTTKSELSELSPGTVHYKNDEKIRVIRGPDRRILGYDTARDAKISE